MAAPETTQATGDAAQAVAFPPFATETFAGQLLWLVITFGALYVLMSKLILPQLTGIIENRRRTIGRDLDEAAAMKTRAEEAGSAYEAALAGARANAQTLAQETRAKLSAESDARRRTLEADLSGRLAAAETQIAATKAQAMGNVRAIAVETTTAIVERLTGRAPSPQAVDSALDQTGR